MTESTELTIFDQTYSPTALFIPGAFDPIFAHIKAQVDSELKDPTTEEGRTRIKSLAFKITKSKTAIEAARVALVSDAKKELAKIDAQGKIIKDKLEAYALEIRAPVTEFENRDKKRIAKHDAALAEIKAMSEFTTPITTVDIEVRLANAKSIDVSRFDEFQTIAVGTKAQVIEKLTALYEASKQADIDRAELERLRQEEIARKQCEREEIIAEEARASEAAKAETERTRLAAEAAASERRAQEAEQARVESERKAEEARVQAEQDAQRRIDEAAKRERLRIADEHAAEAAATAKREANKAHRSKVNSAALDALVKAGVSIDVGKVVVTAIARGLIPSVTIAY